MQSQLTEQAKKLSIPDRILLVEEIWDSIAEENQAFELTQAQTSELDRRLESARANPGQGRTWDEIKAEFKNSGKPRNEHPVHSRSRPRTRRAGNGTLTSAKI